jgi:hypothetical protein
MPLFAGVLLRARRDAPRMAQIAAVPPGEGPVGYDLGIHYDFDEHIEQGNAFELLELIVADFAQLRIARRRV